MKLLVTGGCGFIGSNYIRFTLENRPDVEIVNLDKLTYCGNPENLSDMSGSSRYAFVKGDILDRELIRGIMPGIDCVVNFAAETHVDRSIKYPGDFVMTNASGVNVLLEEARAAGARRFVQISTDEVYGSVDTGLSVETDRLAPRSPYAASKAAGDLLALSYFSTYGFDVIVLRSSNNFGPFQYPEKMIPLFVTELTRGAKVPVYGDGLNAREWLFVRDNCAAIDTALNKGKPGEIYNIGGGIRLTNIELTKKILSVLDKDENSIRFVNDRPGHDRRYALDSSKIKALGWEVSGDFETRLKDTVRWYENNTAWWKRLKEKAEIIQW